MESDVFIYLFIFQIYVISVGLMKKTIKYRYADNKFIWYGLAHLASTRNKEVYR